MRLFDELAYSKKNREKRYEILEGVHKGEQLVFHGVSSYDGDIDFIAMRKHGNTAIVSFHENVEIKEVELNIVKRNK